MTRWLAVITAFLGVAAVAALVGVVTLRSDDSNGTGTGPPALTPAAGTTSSAGTTGAAGTTAAAPTGGSAPGGGSTAAAPGAATDPLCQARRASDQVYRDAWERFGPSDYRSVLRVALPARLAYYERAVQLVNGATRDAFVALVNYQRSENYAYQRFGWDPKAPLRDPVSWPRSPIQAHRLVNALMRTRCGITPAAEPRPAG